MTSFIPPKTIDEVAIHLGNLFEVQKRIEDKIDGIGNKFPTLGEFNDLKIEVNTNNKVLARYLTDRKVVLTIGSLIILLQGVFYFIANKYAQALKIQQSQEIKIAVDDSVQAVLSTYNITKPYDK